MSIAECKAYLGVPLFATLPRKYAHLRTAKESDWQEAVRVEAVDRKTVVTTKGGFSAISFPEPFNVDVIPELLDEARATSLTEKVFQCSPRIEGWFKAEDVREVGQRHEDVPFPTGGRGTMVVAEILTEPDMSGLVKAVMEMQADTGPESEPEPKPEPKSEPKPELIPVLAKMADGQPASAETLRKLAETVNRDGKSEYVKSCYGNGRCPHCQLRSMILIMHQDVMSGDKLELRHPMFFICIHCHWIGELGVGPVKEA